MPTEVASLRKESPVALLELKLKEWMVQQNEWLLIVNMPRQQRRAAMKELANRLYTIPTMDGVNTVPRQVRRKAAKQLAHAAMTGQLTEQVQEALLEAARLEEASLEVTGVPESRVAYVQEDGTPVYTFEAPEASPDPEGDVKADVEKAKDAESLIE